MLCVATVGLVDLPFSCVSKLLVLLLLPAREKPSHMLFGSYDLSIVSDTAAWHYTPVIRHARGQLRYVIFYSTVGTTHSNDTCPYFLRSISRGGGKCRYDPIRECWVVADPTALLAPFFLFYVFR